MIAQNPNAMQPFFPTTDLAAAPPETITVTAPAATPDRLPVNADDTGKSFFDNLLDVVNPLEHFPIVSTIYSNLTGDKPNDFTQVAGDTLYGGPLGLVSSIGNLIFKDVTGKTVGDTVWGWLTDNKSTDTRTASNPPQAMKPSTDLFSFLRANVGNSHESEQLASNASSTSSSAAPSASTPVTPPLSTPGVKTVAQTAPIASTAPAASTASAVSADASAQPRLLNPLPVRGAPPVHNTPSENVRAAGVAQMVASRAHLHGPASEGTSPAMQPAAPPTAASTPVASASPPTVTVGADGVPTLNGNGEQALLDALKKNGISGAIGQQALMAYQKTMAMTPDAGNASALTSAMTLH